MPQVTLHQFYQSHYCIRIRWAMNYKGIPFKTVDYDWNTIDRVKEVSGGWEYVPVLDWNSEIVTDSARIASFLEAQVPQPAIFPGEASPGLTGILLSWVDGLVMRNAGRFMLESYLKYIGPQNAERYEREFFLPAFGMTTAEAIKRKPEWEAALNENWRTLEVALKGRAFLLGPQVSYADFGIASRLRLMEIIGAYSVPGQFPEIRRWFAEVKRLGKDDSVA